MDEKPFKRAAIKGEFSQQGMSGFQNLLFQCQAGELQRSASSKIEMNRGFSIGGIGGVLEVQ